MNRRSAAIVIAKSVLGATASTLALSAGNKRPIPFDGRVESVDKKLRTVGIAHGNIPGFLPAMTTDHPVDRDTWIERLSAGDEISATVYAGDPTLYEVHIIRKGTR
ncbi:MAG TPA: copper-binding protein [Bryobacteraceae bacterium]|nr:copper-binding protein [Bryobacteraceae bacterium]